MQSEEPLKTHEVEAVDKSAFSKHVLVVTTSKKTKMELIAPSAEERDAWHDAIASGLQNVRLQLLPNRKAEEKLYAMALPIILVLETVDGPFDKQRFEVRMKPAHLTP